MYQPIQQSFFRLSCTMLLLIPFFGINAQPEYNAHTNQAELSITKNDYKNALSHYEKAFDEVATPQRFAVDLYNAALCAIETNNTDLALEYCHQLATKGLGKPFFEKNSCFYNIRSKSLKWEAVLIVAESSWLDYRERVGFIIDSINNIARRDQLSDSLYLSNNPKTLNDTLSFLRQKHDAMRDMVNLTKQYGFPSEGLIGVQVKNDTTPIFLPAFSRLKYTAIGVPSIMRKYDQMILVAIQERKIKAEMGAYCFIDDKPIDPFTFYQIVDCNLYANANGEKSVDEIDKNRKALGLCSAYDYILKSLYNLKNPQSKFHIIAPYQLHSYQEGYSKSHFLNRSTLISKKVCQ